MSGLFTAISQMGQNVLGQNVNLRYIDFISYKIYFSQIPGNLGTIALITSGTSYYLQNSLMRFVRAIPEEIKEKLNVELIELGKFTSDFDKLLIQAFPYLTILDKDN
ncbi:MAG: hypothetical protein ACFFBD_29510 [Candidatus Hodarchaeota archaeon]